jgi:hypothetical protein
VLLTIRSTYLVVHCELTNFDIEHLHRDSHSTQSMAELPPVTVEPEQEQQAPTQESCSSTDALAATMSAHSVDSTLSAFDPKPHSVAPHGGDGDSLHHAPDEQQHGDGDGDGDGDGSNGDDNGHEQHNEAPQHDTFPATPDTDDLRSPLARTLSTNDLPPVSFSPVASSSTTPALRFSNQPDLRKDALTKSSEQLPTLPVNASPLSFSGFVRSHPSVDRGVELFNDIFERADKHGILATFSTKHAKSHTFLMVHACMCVGWPNRQWQIGARRVHGVFQR